MKYRKYVRNIKDSKNYEYILVMDEINEDRINYFKNLYKFVDYIWYSIIYGSKNPYYFDLNIFLLEIYSKGVVSNMLSLMSGKSIHNILYDRLKIVSNEILILLNKIKFMYSIDEESDLRFDVLINITKRFAYQDQDKALTINELEDILLIDLSEYYEQNKIYNKG